MSTIKTPETPSREGAALGILHKTGINIGVFSMASASVLAFILSLARLAGAIVFLFDVEPGRLTRTFSSFGVEEKPVVIMLLDIVDTSLLAAILLTFAFGLKSVFLGQRYKVLAFDISNIDELKEILIGLVITLMGTRFLETIFIPEDITRILGSGVGIASVIIALTAYDFILKKYDQKSSGDK